ncbi:hypothetical protein GGR04_003780 [Aureimonas pseudogalii]|uniref:Transposase n=2 Tax=Aureimonas pseudogalii TaxID=1744844 RepID=A0A7W6H7K0_9HYPH|nr:hypothetical protein [Aureimonas pseudogalii]
MIRDRKDITLDEMVERRATERDLHLSRSALSAWLRRQGWTFGPPSRRRGRALCFLPPDSPDFNPIENAFAKLKALLRARAERTVDALWRAVGDIVPVFTPAECTNCFHAAGYDAT